MEREPIEPAVLAVELYRDEVDHRRRTWSLFGMALGCTLLGAGAVIGVIRFAPHWLVPPDTQVAKQSQPIKPWAGSNSLYTEPKDPAPLGPQPQDKPQKEAAVPPTASVPPEGNTPLNPFSGAIISRSPIPGEWEPGTAPPSGPAGLPSNEKPPVQPADPPKKEAAAILITARSSASDPEGEAQSVISSLQGAGASVRQAQHYSLAGSIVGVQIVATVPASAVDSVISRLSSAGVGGADRWSGSIEARVGRVEGMLASRVKELRAKEAELREKYEDDSTEVTVVREEIQKLNQGLGMARSAKSAGIAVILIGIGSL